MPILKLKLQSRCIRFLGWILVVLFVGNASEIGLVENRDKLYLSTNVISPFTMIRFKSDVVDYIALFLSDIEIGPSVNIGYAFSQISTVEWRVSMGINNDLLFIHQYHLYYQINPFRINDRLTKADELYLGLGIKNIAIHYRYNDNVFSHLSPYISLGYKFHKKSNFIFDIRLNQMIGIVSFSNIKNSSASAQWQFSPFPFISKEMPLIQFNMGLFIR